MVFLVAKREVRLLGRSRATLGAVALLAAVAWLPAVLLSLRSGLLGLATFPEVLPLQIALTAVVLPLLALLAGAELFAGELEDRTLVPMLTLPVSRRACFVGKCLGRGGALAVAYLVAFASAGVAIAVAGGAGGWQDWVAVSVSGLLLSVVSGGLGAALGAGGSGRVHALGGALVAWVVLVFVLDALLLTLVVALAPASPSGVGEHGHAELAAPRSEAPTVGSHGSAAEAGDLPAAALSGGLVTLNPVSLFRLTTIATSPGLRPRLGLILPGGTGPPGSSAGFWWTVAAGWLVWFVAPLTVGLYRFQRANLA